MESSSSVKSSVDNNPILCCPKCENGLIKVTERYYCSKCNHSYPVIDGIASFVDPNAVLESFDSSFFEFLFEMEQKHFWHIGRREIILDILRRNIPDLTESKMLEVGCGNGSILTFLNKNGIKVEGGDIFMEGLAFCRQRVNSAPLYQLDVLALPFRDEFDVVGLFDVLEHIGDDTRALIEIRKALKHNGTLLITVPAYRFLWSHFDERSNHQRRYSRVELIAKLEQAGFTVKRVSYYMFFLFPLLAAIRLIGNIGKRRDDRQLSIDVSLETKTVPVINEVFLGLLRLERFFLRYFNLPFGASLIVLAERNIQYED